MKNLSILLCWVFLIMLTQSQLDYQSRIIYYNQTENICVFGPQADIIRLNIKVENYDELLVVDRWGWGNCNNYEHLNKDRISLAITFFYYNEQLGDRVLFRQTMIKNITKGVLRDISAKVVSGSDEICTLRGRPCTCQILGDGQKHHFGNQFPKYAPAYINVACKFTDRDIKQQ